MGFPACRPQTKHFADVENFILLKTYSLQFALHIVVFTYLEDLAGHKPRSKIVGL